MNLRKATKQVQQYVFAILAIAALSGTFDVRALMAQADAQEDSLLLQDIRERLANDSRMPVSGIAIAVRHGAVRLRGVVQTLAQKRWAEELVYQVPGVRVIDNQLWIDRERVSDETLLQEVRRRLLARPDSLFAGVRVEVFQGEVTLKGQVSSWGVKHLAEDLVALTPGVVAIHNDLKIRDPNRRTDRQLQAALEQALRDRIAMSRDFHISLSVVRGVVTMKGRLRSEGRTPGSGPNRAVFPRRCRPCGSHRGNAGIEVLAGLRQRLALALGCFSTLMTDDGTRCKRPREFAAYFCSHSIAAKHVDLQVYSRKPPPVPWLVAWHRRLDGGTLSCTPCSKRL